MDITDENSAGQMQNFNMMVTKARKKGCSMVIVHHTGKSLNIGPDGVPTWRGSYDMATRLDKTICLLPCQSSLDGFVTFQVIEGKSRRDKESIFLFNSIPLREDGNSLMSPVLKIGIS